MDTASTSRRGNAWRVPTLLVATALVVAGCGTNADNGPATTTPTTQTSSTTTTTSTATTPTSATTGSTVAPPVTTTTGAATPDAAIEAWLRSQGYVYAGDCGGATIAPVQRWCSTLSEDGGAERTYKVGRVSSQYEYSLRLKSSDGTWSVVDVDEITIGP